MTQVVRCAVASEADASVLAQKLIALRAGVDAALAELACRGTISAAAEMEKPSQPLPSIDAHRPARRGAAGTGDALDELGVIGCLLGLRSYPAPR